MVFGLLSGISNASLVAVINGAAETVADRAVNWRYTLMYVLLAAVFFYSKKYTLDRSSEIVEGVINRTGAVCLRPERLFMDVAGEKQLMWRVIEALCLGER